MTAVDAGKATVLQLPKALSIQWRCCISLLQSWKETHPYHFIYKFPNEHKANFKCPPEFLWTKCWGNVDCILRVSVQTAFYQVSQSLNNTWSVLLWRIILLPNRQKQPIQYQCRLSLCLLKWQRLVLRPFLSGLFNLRHYAKLIFWYGKGFWTLEWDPPINLSGSGFFSAKSICLVYH